MSDLSNGRSGDESASAHFSENADSVKIERSTDDKRSKQSFLTAVLGGFIGLIIAVCLWALVAYMTQYSLLLLMPISTGLIVGFAVRFLGKGRIFFFGLVGVIFSLVGCFVGHFIGLAAISAAARNTSIVTILIAFLNTEFDEEFLVDSFGTLELVFCAVAAILGYILSVYKNGSKRSA